MVVMFGPPTTMLRRQPIFTASTDCVSIADRRVVCVMCTQLHSCWRTMGGWWFQWLRWLLVSVKGEDWELFAVCGCVHASDFCLRPVWCPSSFSMFAPRSLSKLFLLLNEVTAAYADGWLCRFLQETLLPLLWRHLPEIYVVVWLIEYDFEFRLVVMMMIPRNAFFWLCRFGVWVFAFGFHSSWVKCAGVFMWYRPCDKISFHLLGFRWCHSLILHR